MINTRREKFQDVRLREAFAYAFDFEWANKNLMFDTYARTHSCFQNSEMMAKGKPSPEELALLEPHKDKLRPEVFGEAWNSPVSDGSGQDRRLLRRVGGTAQRRRLDHQGRQARQRQGRAVDRGVSGVRAGVGAAPRALHQEPDRARRRGDDARGRSGAVPLPHAGVRLRHLDEPDRAAADAGRRAARLFLQQVRRRQRLAQLLGHRQSGGGCADRQGDRGQRSPEPLYRLPGARSRAARGALLGGGLVQAVALDRLLGHVRPARRQAALRARRAGDLVVRRRQGGEARAASLPPTAAAAWRGGRVRRAASNAATESAPRRRDRRLSPAAGPIVMLS